ncbi:MAG: hypothetical protein C4K58_00320 [Flavobacteriaceae bacterium]|nr:MAG: hypothetical protein C4K58_00320 [Flavobacteriaceae bacterium]
MKNALFNFKKVGFFSFLTLLVSLFILSCEPDGPIADPIIGSWKYVRNGIIQNGVTTYSTPNCTNYSDATFNSDGTSVGYGLDENCASTNVINYKATWEKLPEANMYELNYSYGKTGKEAYTFIFSNSNNYLRVEHPFNNSIFIIEYSRK